VKKVKISKKTLGLIAVLVPLVGLFIYTAVRSGPLAPVSVKVIKVENRSLHPARFGIGTVEARYRYSIGPTAPGRLLRVETDVGDRVAAGSLLGEMDPVGLDEQLAALAAQERAISARLADAEARKAFSSAQRERYESLLKTDAASREMVALKRQEETSAQAAMDAAKADVTQVQKERAALVQQREDLRLTAPVDGLVIARNTEPGSTLVAGQAAFELLDPNHLWIHARFDQFTAAGLKAGLPAQIVLRSRPGQVFPGQVLRIEPLADAVTEELLAKIGFNPQPPALPPVGELAEVSVLLPETDVFPVIPNAALRRVNDQQGVWVLENGKSLRFAPVKTGVSTLDGIVQILEGLNEGETVVTHSKTMLNAKSRVKVTDSISGGRR
jgi:RND family efflux transporter MFP subunit